MNVATNFQYAGPAFQKSAKIYFYQGQLPRRQFATLDQSISRGAWGPRRGPSTASWRSGASAMAATWTTEPRSMLISISGTWAIQHCLPGQIVLSVDYSANRSNHSALGGSGRD